VKYSVISTDNHINEPPGTYVDRIPAHLKDKAPRLLRGADGGDGWSLDGQPPKTTIGLSAIGAITKQNYREYKSSGIKWEEVPPGNYEGDAALKDMDIDGVDAEVLFPPQRTVGHFLGDADDAFVRAGIEAYNNFLWEEFCAPDRDRLIGMAQMPSTGIDDAVDALRKAKARGFKGVVTSCWPSGGDSISDADDPFWAAASDEGIPVCIHINLVSRRARQSQRKAAEAAAAKGSGGLYGGKAAKANAKAVAGLGSVFSTVPSTIGQLIFTGTFERFPDLQVAMIETGVGWIPHFLEQIDDRYWRNRSWGNIPIKEPPSFYWFRNMSATFITDFNGVENRYGVGVDNMMWSSDYPHHGNDWPYSRRTIDSMMSHIDRDERRRIVGANAARIFGLGA
jgi:predicted TIM-barrel fold metal-dependent hydrolase